MEKSSYVCGCITHGSLGSVVQKTSDALERSLAVWSAPKRLCRTQTGAAYSLGMRPPSRDASDHANSDIPAE